MAVVLAGSCLAVPAAKAADDKPFDTVAVMEKQDRIRRDLSAGTAGFDTLSADKRRELLSRQDALIGIIDGRRYEDLSAEERAKASGEIAWIDSVSSQVADERQVCERIKKAGSNRVERVCMTAQQKREARERAQRTFEGRRSGPENDPSTGL
ncbi:hypothetical protein MNR01_13645 [Lysobacter sp. S4-A87]|uniref:hypothetical protein n=1 Tax=Lysobacter sp. S4-A87 TaxID=2925843 RepID=UPI001F53D1F7|nr:hypothetical protein [Lysobacter sp. S4-A87]UNK48776.1 hypothetical protein MNR01_13645 [Lysobacter sp. S4-A87]